MMGQWSAVFLPLALCLATWVFAAGMDVALKPPMGWNSWNSAACALDEELILESAQALVDSGLRDLGYTYVNLDDCWQADERGPDGSLVAHPDKFPRGIAALGQEVQELGLDLGIYSDAGNFTCGGRPGSLGLEEKDAQTFVSWGIRYLKYDNCYNWNIPVVDRFRRMSDALAAATAAAAAAAAGNAASATNTPPATSTPSSATAAEPSSRAVAPPAAAGEEGVRPVLLSVCEWGVQDPWLWAPDFAHSWRTTDDIKDTFDAMLRVADNSFGLGRFAGPGKWNDLDMLEVGNGGMTDAEYRAMFAIWAAVKSPLLLGNDVRNMTEETLAIVSARELIAVNQDELGVPADVVDHNGPLVTLAGPLADGSRVAVMWNRHTHDNAPEPSECGPGSPEHPSCPYDVEQTWPGYRMTLPFAWLGYAADARAEVRDLYAEEDLGHFTGSFQAWVPVRGVRAVKVTPLRAADKDTSWRPWPPTITPPQPQFHEDPATPKGGFGSAAIMALVPIALGLGSLLLVVVVGLATLAKQPGPEQAGPGVSYYLEGEGEGDLPPRSPGGGGGGGGGGRRYDDAMHDARWRWGWRQPLGWGSGVGGGGGGGVPGAGRGRGYAPLGVTAAAVPDGPAAASGPPVGHHDYAAAGAVPGGGQPAGEGGRAGRAGSPGPVSRDFAMAAV